MTTKLMPYIVKWREDGYTHYRSCETPSDAIIFRDDKIKDGLKAEAYVIIPRSQS